MTAEGFTGDKSLSLIGFFICLLLISFSAYLSASEVALFSLSKFQLRSIKDRAVSSHRKIKRLLSDPGGLLITILVANEVLNISISVIVTRSIGGSQQGLLAFCHRYFPIVPIWIIHVFFGVLITAPLLLLFCDITPKVIGTRMNRIIAVLTIGPLSVIYGFFKPIRFALRWVVGFIQRNEQRGRKGVVSHRGGGRTNQGDQLEQHPERRREDRYADSHEDADESKRQGSAFAAVVAANEVSSEFPNEFQGAVDRRRPSEELLLKEEDFLFMVEEGQREGAINENELELIKNVLDLDNTTVGDVLTPVGKVRTILAGTTLKAALSVIRGVPYSRIPVTAADRKSILGVLHTKDLLQAKLEPEMLTYPVESIMHKPLFVSSTAKLSSVFRKFKQYRTHMVIVRDAGFKVIGIITLRDVLGALFDDLFLGANDFDSDERENTHGTGIDQGAKNKKESR